MIKSNLASILYPKDYDIDFEKLLPEEYRMSASSSYRLNKATQRLCSGTSGAKYTDKTVVCKHWLRGLCKKGDLCEFLHEYDLKKIPECWFYTKYGECSNPECMYLHVDPERKVRYCAYYDRGFCPKGGQCKDRHMKRAACARYLVGFCPKGPKCHLVHPKIFVPLSEEVTLPVQDPIFQYPDYYANNFIPVMQHEEKKDKVFRPLEEVTCFKCGMKGHYANRCSKRSKQYRPSTITVPVTDIYPEA